MLLAENDPYYVALRHLSAVAFGAHPYRAPVGDWISNVSRITLKGVKDYFHIFYSPETHNRPHSRLFQDLIRPGVDQEIRAAEQYLQGVEAMHMESPPWRSKIA